MMVHKTIAKVSAWPFMLTDNMQPDNNSEGYFELPIKRRTGNRLIPYILRIEKGTGILLEERRADVPPPAPVPATQDNRILRTVERFGMVIQTVASEGTVRHVVRPDLSDRHKMNWMQDFFDKAKPCYFEGCAELRTEYDARRANLGEECSTCALSALVQEFNTKLELLYDPTSNH